MDGAPVWAALCFGAIMSFLLLTAYELLKLLGVLSLEMAKAKVEGKLNIYVATPIVLEIGSLLFFVLSNRWKSIIADCNVKFDKLLPETKSAIVVLAGILLVCIPFMFLIVVISR